MPRLLIALLAATTLGAVVPEYLSLGFLHILPHGLDHVLFILGLFLVARSVETLLWQVTLFTVAHSLTLGLSLFGLVALPMQWVEVAIALSITFIAVENLWHDQLARWRPLMIFGFGLVHGLGFAHSFEGAPTDPALLLPALFSYNVGIELGQLALVGLATLAVGTWWSREWYGRIIARPASVLIAVTGLWWAVERL